MKQQSGCGGGWRTVVAESALPVKGAPVLLVQIPAPLLFLWMVLGKLFYACFLNCNRDDNTAYCTALSHRRLKFIQQIAWS
jgi:hypothetical protein